MKFMLDISIPSPSRQIGYSDRIMLNGSCFSEHIGGKLSKLKFSVLQNPHGILFDPVSVCKSIDACIEKKKYVAEELFFLNELWHSWDHHSVFSGTRAGEVIAGINTSVEAGYGFLSNANFLIITLGSAFSYQLADNDQPVANCHRAPGQWFKKKLLSVATIMEQFHALFQKLKQFNPGIQIIFTVSPVRHIRDGVIENNRSKARLLEVVHSLVEEYESVVYFPAYELVIDVLRDYRFYDIDLVHPNYSATGYVFESFISTFVKKAELRYIEEIQNIAKAFTHKPFHSNTQAHRAFLENYLKKVQAFMSNNPQIDLREEEAYFSHSLKEQFTQLPEARNE